MKFRLEKKSISFFMIFFVIFGGSAAATIPNIDAHSLFNSAEQTIGNHRMQIATLPEFPQVGEKSQILFRFTDEDFNEVDSFTMGIRIDRNEERIQTFAPQLIESGHWEMDYIFETSGNHIFRVDIYDLDKDDDDDEVLTYTFNMSTQSPFGYIFILAITIGAVTFAIVVGYIYLPQILRKIRS